MAWLQPQLCALHPAPLSSTAWLTGSNPSSVPFILPPLSTACPCPALLTHPFIPGEHQGCRQDYCSAGRDGQGGGGRGQGHPEAKGGGRHWQ